MSRDTLNALVGSYAAGTSSLREVLSGIALEMHGNPRLFGLYDAEQAAEIFSRHYARFERLVERYEDKGASFYSLIVTTVRFMAKSEYSNRKREADKSVAAELTEKHYRSKQAESANAPTRPPMDPGDSVMTWLSEKFDRKLSSNEIEGMKTKLLVLCMKSAWWIGPERIEDVASATGKSPDELARCVAAAKERIAGKAEKVEKIALRKNDAFVKLCTLEHRWMTETDSEKRKELGRDMDLSRSRFFELDAVLKKARVVPDNRVIADILKIPKGTVDSCMYHLKEDLAKAGSGS